MFTHFFEIISSFIYCLSSFILYKFRHIFNMYYLFTLHEYKSFSVENNESINKMKLFDKDKLIIILMNNTMKLFNISTNVIICQVNLPLNTKFINIEIIDNKRFIIHNNFSTIAIYQIIEDITNNGYTCTLRNILNEYKLNKIIYTENKLICLAERFRIYGYNNNIINKQLEIKTLSTYFNGFKFNEELICTLSKLKNNNNKITIEFWIIRNFSIERKYDFIKQNLYDIANYKFINLNNNDNILLALNESFYIYSFKINSISKIIDFNFGFIINVSEIKALYPLNDNEIYFLYNNDINVLNLKYEYFYSLNQWKYEFNNSLILLKKENIIANNNNKIIFFKSSKIKTLIYSIFQALLVSLINYYIQNIIFIDFIHISFNRYYFIYNLLSIFFVIRMRYFQIFTFDNTNMFEVGLFFILAIIFPIVIITSLFILVNFIFIFTFR